jgi:hypothetical protein
LQREDFITVEGPDMHAKLTGAIKKAAIAAPRAHFWVAYSFPLRPDVTIDPAKGEFVGSANDLSDLSVFIARASNSPGGTRNVGVFLLHNPGGAAISRVEIYNLDRRGKLGGYPVYWLGRPTCEESLSLLQRVIGSNPGTKAAENATLAIALHDDPRVGGKLKELARASTDVRARKPAIHWLGFSGGEYSFLAELVANTREPVTVRKAAASAIGVSGNSVPLSTLTGLYETVTELGVRRALLYPISINADQEGALNFLRKVAKTDFDAEARRQAASWLHEKADAKR